MTMAIELKRMGVSNFTILEKAGEVGGTWRDNIYPGCASDVAIHFYCLSTDLRSDWTHSHAFQPAIQEYWLQVARKYDLYSHIIFNRKVVSAQWDIRTQKYDMVTEDLDGTLIPLAATIIVSATGLLEIPRFPDIPGISSFQGDSFHSARWNYDISLVGKRVAVIGSGASATQFVPIISEDPTVQVKQFCRSPSWILPPVRREYSPAQKWLFKYMPLYLRTYRNLVYLWNEMLYFAIFENQTLSPYVQKSVKGYMAKSTPAQYVDHLIPSDPNHKLGCKRLLYDTNYLTSLARPNLSLVYAPIESIGAEGILTKEGPQVADVIIYATGYITDDYPINIRGTEKTVSEYYRAHFGPTAYRGTCIPTFPNFFTLSGANTATGHTSVLFAEEVQVQYILQLIKPVLAGDILSMEVTAEAADTYNRDIQNRLSGCVWSNCVSWYKTGNTGKIHALFPGYMTLFWWWTRRPNWSHYKVVTVGRWEPRHPFRGAIGAALWGGAGMGLAGVAYLAWLGFI
ncbi:hypothetical protein B0H16DRAFT_1523576 [Mycena metata]|uniref:Monooxygenase n=1 Tax=Mycena metata TaxID=1033252 RepID=A0AAD7JIJ5_9AGAR|nr:hypothetical protein B0H16DRAFT_1523533 [Mycena metata]KAJ7765596.1 hypothetical protein B0H16DRAFT_1523576 [Mycena metata]